jgi:alanine-glyoxylate transaminase/serine-glyoxylate transaminase/serine-pyruvate transaminase
LSSTLAVDRAWDVDGHGGARTCTPSRLLLGAGPSPVPPRIMQALSQPTLSHFDPAFIEILEDVSARLRATLRTRNDATLALAATGSGGMEAVVGNFVEPGDRVVAAVAGEFGRRLADAAERAGAEVVRVRAAWGRSVPQERLIEAARDGVDAMLCVHGETSTGVRQPLDGLADACRERDGLLIVDCVTSFGGEPLRIDEQGIDVAFSATQKCLNAPPGLSPVTANDRALERLQNRRKARSWYFDMSMLLRYWLGDGNRPYHHTAPSNMLYALREALLLLEEEGLERRWARHARAHEALLAAFEVLGFVRLPREEDALNPVLALRTPDRIVEWRVRARLLERHGIELSGGLGHLNGVLWRIGVMGCGARREVQREVVTAVAAELDRDPSEALEALEAGWAT